MIVSWLFIATLPNAGSTAFARLIETSSLAVTLGPRAEGQWLVPELVAEGRRWDPSWPRSFDSVRAVWSAAVEQKAADTCVVVEKSPPNLCRMGRLMAAFSDRPVKLVRFMREPLAVCASWAQRYPPEIVVAEWAPRLAGQIRDEATFFEALGGIYGERAVMMRELEGLADLTLTYEGLTARPEAALQRVVKLYPELGRLRADAELRVKDYPPQRLRNFNEEQRTWLSRAQIGWIERGLVPYGDALAHFGYRAG